MRWILVLSLTACAATPSVPDASNGAASDVEPEDGAGSEVSAQADSIVDAGPLGPDVQVVPPADTCACPDDGNPCTVDQCEAGGCKHVQHDGPCDDGNVCTLDDACIMGKCVGKAAANTYCGQDDKCRFGGHCENGACVFQVNKDCSTSQICGQPYCDPADGVCKMKPTPEGMLQCDDKNPCTSETCTINMGCVHTPVPGCSP